MVYANFVDSIFFLKSFFFAIPPTIIPTPFIIPRIIGFNVIPPVIVPTAIRDKVVIEKKLM